MAFAVRLINRRLASSVRSYLRPNPAVNRISRIKPREVGYLER